MRFALYAVIVVSRTETAMKYQFLDFVILLILATVSVAVLSGLVVMSIGAL
jgi:hypothetical protein